VTQIEVDFEVFKALTSLRQHENHTYNQVIRELLDLGEPVLSILPDIDKFGDALSRTLSGGFLTRGLFLPNGTSLRATYKGVPYIASIKDGEWIAMDGTPQTSPSAAARAITNTNVNGWRFWQARRPSDDDWKFLDALPKQRS